MKKYTFVSIIDNKAVFTDGKNYYIDTLLTESDATPGMFTEIEEPMLKAEESELGALAKIIERTNERLIKFAIVNYNSSSHRAEVVGISDGTPEGEEGCTRRFLVENPDFNSICDKDFEQAR